LSFIAMLIVTQYDSAEVRYLMDTSFHPQWPDIQIDRKGLIMQALVRSTSRDFVDDGKHP